MGGKLSELAANKAKRDQLLEKVKQSDSDSRLPAAVAATNWLIDQHLTWSYRGEIESWFELAQKADAENAAGYLEVFLEAQVFIRLAKINANDVVAVVQSLGMMNDFLTARRFHDPDRGFRLHMIVFKVLHECNDEEQALAA